VRVAAALLVLTTIPAAACVAAAPIGPSAVIVPDIVGLRVGASQVFTVYNGNVRKFTVFAGGTGAECVEIDSSYDVANSVRVIARQICTGMAYVNADIGVGRTPLVSAISVNAP